MHHRSVHVRARVLLLSLQTAPLSRGEFTIHAWVNGLLEAALALGAAGLGACPRVERGSPKVRQAVAPGLMRLSQP